MLAGLKWYRDRYVGSTKFAHIGKFKKIKRDLRKIKRDLRKIPERTEKDPRELRERAERES